MISKNKRMIAVEPFSICLVRNEAGVNYPPASIQLRLFNQTGIDQCLFGAGFVFSSTQRIKTCQVFGPILIGKYFLTECELEDPF